jgi:hypothetical protein
MESPKRHLCEEPATPWRRCLSFLARTWIDMCARSEGEVLQQKILSLSDPEESMLRLHIKDPESATDEKILIEIINVSRLDPKEIISIAGTSESFQVDLISSKNDTVISFILPGDSDRA